jgi:putative ABC transport system permease protein
MVRLALRTLRFRAGRFVACLVVLFFGGLIVMSCGGLMETGIRAAVPPQRLAAAPVVVTGDPSYPERARIDAGLVAVIKDVPGVAGAVRDLSFPATPLRDHEPVAEGGGLLGHGWASAGLAPYTLTRGVAPKRPDEVVLDHLLLRKTEAEVGDLVDIAVAGEARQFRVVGVVESTSVRGDQYPAIFFSDPYAQGLAGERDEIDDIGVLAEPGADIGELQRTLAATLEGHSVAVLTGDDRGLAEFGGVRTGCETLIVIAAVFGGLAVMVAVFVVASILGLSVQQRYREMALLRAIGATPGQVRRMVLGEALVVAVLATGLAYVPEVYVGRWLLSQLSVRDVVPSAIAYRQGWIPTVSATGVALLSALGAAYIAGRSAARARPTDALLDASLPRRWLSWPAWCSQCCASGWSCSNNRDRDRDVGTGSGEHGRPYGHALARRTCTAQSGDHQSSYCPAALAVSGASRSGRLHCHAEPQCPEDPRGGSDHADHARHWLGNRVHLHADRADTRIGAGVYREPASRRRTHLNGRRVPARLRAQRQIAAGCRRRVGPGAESRLLRTRGR